MVLVLVLIFGPFSGEEGEGDDLSWGVSELRGGSGMSTGVGGMRWFLFLGHALCAVVGFVKMKENRCWLLLYFSFCFERGAQCTSDLCGRAKNTIWRTLTRRLSTRGSCLSSPSRLRCCAMRNWTRRRMWWSSRIEGERRVDRRDCSFVGLEAGLRMSQWGEGAWKEMWFMENRLRMRRM